MVSTHLKKQSNFNSSPIFWVKSPKILETTHLDRYSLVAMIRKFGDTTLTLKSSAPRALVRDPISILFAQLIGTSENPSNGSQLKTHNLAIPSSEHICHQTGRWEHHRLKSAGWVGDMWSCPGGYMKDTTKSRRIINRLANLCLFYCLHYIISL